MFNKRRTCILQSVALVRHQKSDLTPCQLLLQTSQSLVTDDHDFQMQRSRTRQQSDSRSEGGLKDGPCCVTCLPFAATHRRTFGMSIVLPPFPSTTKGLMTPSPSHLTASNTGSGTVSHALRISSIRVDDKPSSFAQFLTSVDGQTMIPFSTVPLPGKGDCLRRVWRRAMHWSVLPARKRREEASDGTSRWGSLVSPVRRV